MANSSFYEEQAKRLYGLGTMEQEALTVLRLVLCQTEAGRNLDADLLARAKEIVARYDLVLTRGHDGPSVLPFGRGRDQPKNT